MEHLGTELRSTDTLSADGPITEGLRSDGLSIGYGRPHQDGAVLDLFTAWAHRTPDAPALIDGEQVYSYAELDRLADTVAEALRGRVGPGDLLGVCLAHSVSLVAVTLAAAKLGAVHLPLGPAWPRTNW
ncbi:AMP-binding protein [Kitasatospora sp. MY 5-36]|uniref:AMP-binding protein n=1 Tax=Kitasatospora sp. MY 5-36 TaxID=1678027 RepID=UPI0009E6D0B2|nr:AMP-binding protein [Kitasatospora sp. MY 5-36]